MTQSLAQRARRSNERRIRSEQLEARNQLLETALHAAWLWLSQDGTDLEALRQVLLRADREHQIHAALDRLVKEPIK